MKKFLNTVNSWNCKSRGVPWNQCGTTVCLNVLFRIATSAISSSFVVKGCCDINVQPLSWTDEPMSNLACGSHEAMARQRLVSIGCTNGHVQHSTRLFLSLWFSQLNGIMTVYLSRTWHEYKEVVSLGSISSKYSKERDDKHRGLPGVLFSACYYNQREETPRPSTENVPHLLDYFLSDVVFRAAASDPVWLKNASKLYRKANRGIICISKSM